MSITYARLREILSIIAIVGLFLAGLALEWKVATGGLDWSDAAVRDLLKFVVDFYASVLVQMLTFYLARLAASRSLSVTNVNIPAWIPLGIVASWAMLPPAAILFVPHVESVPAAIGVMKPITTSLAAIVILFFFAVDPPTKE